MAESHPLRVRGLKQRDASVYIYDYKSHPLRVRGLKLMLMFLTKKILVASFTGAWIETVQIPDGK